MSFGLETLRQCLAEGRIEWRKQTLRQLARLHICQTDALSVLHTGAVVPDFTDGLPFSRIIVLGWVPYAFGWAESHPLHVVAHCDVAKKRVYIITVYEPSLDGFEADFKTRKA